MDRKKKTALLLFDVICIALTMLCGKASKWMEHIPMMREGEMTVEESSYTKCIEEAVSEPRVINESVFMRKKSYELNEEDYENLLRIVEAEATGEDLKGRILVANVVMNRVKSRRFPNSVTQVFMQRDNGKVQFSPVADGRFGSVSISEKTREAVKQVIYGTDYSEGAMYFVSAKGANEETYSWFRGSLNYLFTHGGHEFYK
ncbi:MAG: cell wall hydrolase [Lachnospiraceae bacterium]|nr:cell wall hydrolase [Lachnospiraceae bacterium]